MTDTLDTQIRDLVRELMDSAPQAPPLPDIRWRETQGAGLVESSDAGASSTRPRNHSRRLLLVAAFVALAAVVTLAGLLVIGGGNAPRRPTIANQRSGTWKLADDQLSGTWKEYTAGGPPPGSLSCPSTSTCYAMGGQYQSPSAGAKPLSESLYVSTDAGSTWSDFPMPQGFIPTSTLSCGGTADCAAGGTFNGKPILITTADGGHTFATAPLPIAVGHLDTLSCTSSGFCAGLAADSEALNVTTTNATFLSTSDGGRNFTDQPILAGDSMQSLSCSSSLDCTAVGWNNAIGPNDFTAGVAARTTDGGQTWVAGTLPAGLGISYLSRVSCADALHCSVIGNIAITTTNPGPPNCVNVKLPRGSNQGNALPTNVQSPAVKAISQVESRAATKEVLKEAKSKTELFPCFESGAHTTWINDIATTTNGGLSWTPDSLPANVPAPMLSDLSCPTASQCWAAGSEAAAQQVGKTLFGGSSVVLGTTSGGRTWSKVTFNVPKHIQTYNGKVGEGIGSIDCPSAGVCVALGVGTQSAPSVPTYSLVVPGSS